MQAQVPFCPAAPSSHLNIEEETFTAYWSHTGILLVHLSLLNMIATTVRGPIVPWRGWVGSGHTAVMAAADLQNAYLSEKLVRSGLCSLGFKVNADCLAACVRYCQSD